MSSTPCRTGSPLKRRRTLTFRLVAVFSALLFIVIVVLSFASITMLRSYLIHSLDEDLQTSGRLVANELVKDLVSGAPEANQSMISDYYLYVSPDSPISSLGGIEFSPIQRIAERTYQKYGVPSDPEALLAHEIGVPFTTKSTLSGNQWRVITMNLTREFQDQRQHIGTILIGRPLTPVYATASAVTLGIVTTAFLVALGGAVLAYFLIRSSLRPLHGIERATHQIADGDLSQRVPEGMPGSEAAHLASSINIMLEQIEHSFLIKEQSEHQMRQFVSDASHELRTPLATVRGYAELYRIGGVPEEHVPTTMDRIESEAKRMTGLVEDLLQLARLDEGRPLNFQRVSVTEVALNAVMDYRVRTNDRPALVIGLDGGKVQDVTITADHDKVIQVITNLLGNVLTHTPEGTPVEVAVGMRENTAVVEVRDHGPGVPPEAAAHLFERFFRLDYSRSRASGGSGLGLAIVASIMAAHNGRAEIDETKGGGLTVRLVFPAAQPFLPAPEATAF